MAMIKCPKCNEDVSDKSTKCIHCGHVLIEKPKLFCEECGNEIRKSDKLCSKCGCPIDKQHDLQKVEVTKIKIGNDISKKKIIIGIAVFLLIVGGIFGFITIKNNSDKKKTQKLSEQYEDNLSTITYKMLSGAASAETCGNKIKKVWSNSIWKDDDDETDKYTKTNGKFNEDFNDSLSALFADPDFIKTTDNVEKNQKEVNKLMKEMKQPPEEWKEAYNDLKDYYDDYLTLTNLCTNPSGSLQTYSTNFNNADTDALNGYNKIKSYLAY